jgi:hypothetical protein
VAVDWLQKQPRGTEGPLTNPIPAVGKSQSVKPHRIRWLDLARLGPVTYVFGAKMVAASRPGYAGTRPGKGFWTQNWVKHSYELPSEFARSALRETGNPSASAGCGFRLVASLRPEMTISRLSAVFSALLRASLRRLGQDPATVGRRHCDEVQGRHRLHTR